LPSELDQVRENSGVEWNWGNWAISGGSRKVDDIPPSFSKFLLAYCNQN